jgi:hypothetical protein
MPISVIKKFPQSLLRRMLFHSPTPGKSAEPPPGGLSGFGFGFGFFLGFGFFTINLSRKFLHLTSRFADALGDSLARLPVLPSDACLEEPGKLLPKSSFLLGSEAAPGSLKPQKTGENTWPFCTHENSFKSGGPRNSNRDHSDFRSEA